MRTGCYYLNNSGHRWVILPKPKITVVFPDWHEEGRTIILFEAFGNFASVQLSIGGKKKMYLPASDGKVYINSEMAYIDGKESSKGASYERIC